MIFGQKKELRQKAERIEVDGQKIVKVQKDMAQLENESEGGTPEWRFKYRDRNHQGDK